MKIRPEPQAKPVGKVFFYMENGTRMDILPNFHIHIKYQLKLGGEGSLKISDFQTKDVINIVDGKKLGQISDLELDLRNGRIEAIVVPNSPRFFGLFGGATDVIIPWRNIVKIGMDVVLVKIEDMRSVRQEETEVSYEYNRNYREGN